MKFSWRSSIYISVSSTNDIKDYAHCINAHGCVRINDNETIGQITLGGLNRFINLHIYHDDKEDDE